MFLRYFITVVLFCAIFSASQLLGGWSPVKLNENDESFNHVLKFAVEHLQNVQNSGKVVVLKEVLSAEKQLVSGMNYRIKLILGHTNCGVSSTRASGDVANCQVNKLQTCDVKIYYKSWEDYTELTDYSCGEFSQVKRSLLGGEEEVDQKEVEDALKFAVEQLNSESNGFYKVSLHGVKHVTKQVVAGLKIKAEISLKLKSCGKELVSACPEPNEEITECKIEVLDQAWMTPRFSLLSHKCDGSTKIGKLKFSPNSNENAKTQEKTLDVQGLEKMTAAEAFQIFKEKYNKVYYNVAEEMRRQKIFTNNIARARFYQDHDLGTATYGATRFADLTEQEFEEKYLSKKWDITSGPKMEQAVIPRFEEGDLPTEFDWRNYSVVSSVKDQGSCGSCWAFSVAGNIEGQWAIQKGQLLSLSEQQMVDCDTIDMGCEGGLPSWAYSEIQRIGGLEVEDDYPYHGRHQNCTFDQNKVRAYINGSLNISSNEAEMAAWLVKNGPMSIGIDALFMQFYFGGISHPWSIFCPKALNHGVLIVGYGISKGFFWNTPYWIVKNSWGPRWGEHGYYLVYRGAGTCGLNLMVSSAVVH